jgi:hypothetical protein
MVFGAAAALGCAAAVTAGAQVSNPSSTARSAEATRYVAPRTADGRPDLQGVWANNMATPLERPKELAGKAVLTDAELEQLRRWRRGVRRRALSDGAVEHRGVRLPGRHDRRL